MPDDPQRLVKFFARANTIMRPLLKSPLHALLSSRLMLLSYVGGKTGRKYVFAVGYFPWDDGDVLMLSSANWPKTINSANNIQVLIKRRWLHAEPTVIRQDDQKADILGEFAQRNGPKAAKGLMLGLPGDRQPDRQELLAAAAKTTLVRFALGSNRRLQRPIRDLPEYRFGANHFARLTKVETASPRDGTTEATPGCLLRRTSPSSLRRRPRPAGRRGCRQATHRRYS